MAKHLGSAVADVSGLYAAADRCGSYYFKPKTRRFFNSRVTNVQPVPGRDMTYFVEAFGGGRTPVARAYRIGVFKGCEVTILGKGRGSMQGRHFSTARAANAMMKKIASKANKAGPSRTVAARRDEQAAQDARFHARVRTRRATR